MAGEEAMPELSIVVPVYNSAELVPQLYQRLVAVLEGVAFEIVFVEDASPDNLAEVLRGLRRADPRVRYLRFSRNFGHQTAVTAGMDVARGRAVVVMDDDLQDPPETVPELVARWRDGFQVVYAVRRNRKESLWKRAAYGLFYRLLARLSPLGIPLDSGDFALYDRRVVEVLRAMPERSRYLRGMRVWAGFRQAGVPYERAGRAGGSSTYSLSMLLSLAASGITGFSTVPLRLSFLLGAAAALLSFLGGLFLVYLKLARGVDVPGWTSLAVLLLFLSGLQLFSTGITNEYLARVFEEVKGRPLYIVEEAGGCDPGRPGERARPAEDGGA